MTRELIIDGQHVDLAPDTDITLEYVNNVIGDIGKINLPRSYTAKLPKTTRNAKILDDPGRPGHESGQTRRFMSARYYRNGIDLIGPAQAYILKTTPDAYEVALVWNTLEALQTLSKSGENLNDLPDLPVLPWIGADGMKPDYTGTVEGGAFFAFYNSGLGASIYPTVNTSTHPSMYVSNLINRILTNAGVPYIISETARVAMTSKVVLAAPKHNPSRSMEIDSGSVAGSVSFKSAYGFTMEDWTHGWDAPSNAEGITTVFQTGDNDTHRILLNLQAPSTVDLSGVAIYVRGAIIEDQVIASDEELLRAYFIQNEEGWYLYLDEELKLSGWPQYIITSDVDEGLVVTLAPYDSSLPMAALHRVHDKIDIANDNRFPLQGNLPEIKQWDFIKACMALFGWAPIIQNGTLHLRSYTELLSTSNAYDWTEKVDMTDGDDMAYTLDGWAQRNTIAFQEDAPLGFEPNADLLVQDQTLSEQRDRFELPFAASMQSDAQHYKVKDDNTVEDVDIEPRIFEAFLGLKGMTLYFADTMYGQGLIDAYYTRLQETVRKPVAITTNIRLHEIDLAQLDLTRPVYLGQYGRYYVILKIQTSKTDLCKVELLQIS